MNHAYYRYEDQLVRQFCAIMQSGSSPWGQLVFDTEFNYRNGKTDIIALNSSGDIIAFEAKLERWRDALHQAYKNTCFAHLSYVVLPYNVASRAIRHKDEFMKRSIGLCSIQGTSIKIHLDSPQQFPLLPWLSSTATCQIRDKSTSEINHVNIRI